MRPERTWRPAACLGRPSPKRRPSNAALPEVLETHVDRFFVVAAAAGEIPARDPAMEVFGEFAFKADANFARILHAFGFHLYAVHFNADGFGVVNPIELEEALPAALARLRLGRGLQTEAETRLDVAFARHFDARAFRFDVLVELHALINRLELRL